MGVEGGWKKGKKEKEKERVVWALRLTALTCIVVVRSITGS
jgi:hypothetical protein